MISDFFMKNEGKAVTIVLNRLVMKEVSKEFLSCAKNFLFVEKKFLLLKAAT